MKKFLSSLVSFSFIWLSGSNMIGCIEQFDDLEKDLTSQSIKNDLQIAKDFLLTNHLTIDTIFANENTAVYIDYLKSKHQSQIKNDINFLFNENEFEGLAEGEQQVLAILNHRDENETVNVKFNILSDLEVANNILNQAKMKLQSKIKAIGLLANSPLNPENIDKIINLIQNQISNKNVQVEWINNPSLKVLESNKENKIQVQLLVKKEEDNSLIASKVVEVTLDDVSDSLDQAYQNLLNEAESRLTLFDGQGLSENDDLSSSKLRQEITDLLQTTLNNSQITIKLLTESKTLKESNNEVKVKLIIPLQQSEAIEREITVRFFNIISSQKHDNIIFLKEKLPQILNSVDGSNLPSDFSVNNSEVWKLINKAINNPNVRIIAPPTFKNNIITIQQQPKIIRNDLRLGKMFRGAFKSGSKAASKPKISTKRTIKTRTKVKSSKSTTKKNPTQRKKDSVNSKDKADAPTQKESAEQVDAKERLEYLQEKMEQAESLSQTFIDQLVETDISAKLNDYNIFALVTIGFAENAVSDIVPVKFINVGTTS